MKKRLGALLLAVMMVMGIALLTGCSPKNPLVGTWEALDGEDFDFGGCTLYMKFNKDGQWVLWLGRMQTAKKFRECRIRAHILSMGIP